MTAISWKTGQSDLWTNPAAWSTGTVPGSTDDVTIGVAPLFAGLPYTVTLQANESVHSVTQSQAASTIELSNSGLTVAATYALAGKLFLNGGTLQGGTVTSAGGRVILAASGLISGVAWHGTLNVALLSPNPFYYSYTSINLTNDSFVGVGGSGAGSIVLGSGVQAILNSATAFSDVSVSLNDAALAQGAGTLQIGSLSTITASGVCLLGYYGAAIQNTGNISATGTGTSLSVTATSFSGQGTVSVSNGASLFIAGGTVANAGLLSVGAGSYMDVQSSNAAGLFQNTQFQVQGGTLSLNASLTTAQLAALEIATGTLAISGSLQNAGSTLAPGAGSNLANLDLAGGTITGGTIVSQGGFSVGDDAPQALGYHDGPSQLNGVTVEGPLDIGVGAQLNLNGFTLTGAGGSGAGSIAMGGGAMVTVLDNETLNAAIDIGIPTDPYYYTAAGLFANETLTLGAQSVVKVFATDMEIAGSNGSGMIVNQGTIDEVSASASLYLYNVVNTGQIGLSGGELQVQGLTNTGTITDTSDAININGLLINSGLLSLSGTAGTLTSYGNEAGLDNAGTFSVSNGGSAYLATYGESWTNTGTFVIAHAEISVGGTFTTAQLGHVQASQGGTLSLSNGTLVNSGTLTIGQGSNIAALALGGVIQGGTIIDLGAGLLGYGGILSDVAYEGVLALTQFEVYLSQGTTFTGLSGSGKGSISITGSATSLLTYGNELLDHVAVSLGSAVSAGATLGASNGDTLTLGTSATVTQAGAFAELGNVQYGGQGVVVNQGIVTASVAGGMLSLAGSLTNAGTVAVSNGDTLLLSLQGLTNTGVISVTNATADVQNATLAQLLELHLVNSVLTDTGTLTATGGTLSVGAGGFAPLLQVEGTILGGTIHDAGGGVQFAGTATLNGVTYQGVLAENRPLSTVSVINGLTLQGLQGSSIGSLALTGAGSTLVWDSTQALDNAVVSIGSSGTSYGGHVIAASSLVASTLFYSTPPVLLGGHLHIVQSGLYADIGSSFGTFSSAATLTANVAGGQFLLQGASFTNTGTIGVSGTDTVVVDSVGFTNAGLMVVGTGSAVDLDLYNYFAQGSLAAQSFTNTGTLMMAGGMVMELTDNGAFPNVPLLNAAGGHIAGTGVVASKIDNMGTVEAHGGVLNLVQAVSGTGALLADSGAMLVLGGVGAGQTAGFSGVGGVLGLQPAYFLGTVGGFASGDTIDLFNTSAHSAAFSGNSIVVALSSGGTLRLATTSALTGSLSVTAGTHGDELIRFAAGAGVPAPHAVAAPQATIPLAYQPDPAPPIGYSSTLLPGHHAL